MGLYYEYRGQYSRLNNNILFGHHQEWDIYDLDGHKGKSYSADILKKISRFSEVTFNPGYRIIKIDPAKTSYVIERKYTDHHRKFGYPHFEGSVFSRELYNTRFGCKLGDNRDVVPDETATLTVFTAEYFLGNKVLRIVAYDDSGVFVEYLDKTNFYIPKALINSLIPEKVL